MIEGVIEPDKPRGWDDTTIALCPTCRVPLVWTLQYRGSEWICIDCGGLYGFLDVDDIAATELLIEKLAASTRLFDDAAHGLIGGGMYRADCNVCSGGQRGSHVQHANETEMRSHHAAVKRVRELVEGRVSLRAAGRL